MTTLERVQTELMELLDINEIPEGHTFTAKKGRARIINEAGEIVQLQCTSCDTMQSVNGFFQKGNGRRRAACKVCETEINKHKLVLKRLQRRKNKLATAK